LLKALPDPWPESMYYFDLYDSYPLLVRYSNLHVWYYGVHVETEASPETLMQSFQFLLRRLGISEFYSEVDYGRG
jgi:hypothetical protein